MNKRQEAKLAMAHTVCRQLAARADVTVGIVAYPVAFRSLCEALDRGEQLALTQARRLEATLAQRDTTVEAMIDTALALAAAVTAVADPARHGPIATRVRATAGDFNRVGYSTRVRMAQQIADSIRTALPLLVDDGITVDLVDALQARIDAAAEALPSPRVHSVERKTATAEIAATLRKIEHILKAQLDPMLRPLRKKHSEFYHEYLAARMIVDAPTRRRRSETPDENTASIPGQPIPLGPTNNVAA
jgi:hypothetical protein